MRFRTFLQLNEWIYDDIKLQTWLTNQMQNLDQLLLTKDFYEAGRALEELWKRLLNTYEKAVSLNNKQEVDFLKPYLNRLHEINKSVPEIRNVSTKHI